MASSSSRAEPVPGYIHRMHEKMGENRPYAQFLPNTSRIDYLSASALHACFCVRGGAGAKDPGAATAEYIRVITSELNRDLEPLRRGSGLFCWTLVGSRRCSWPSTIGKRSCVCSKMITGARLTYSATIASAASTPTSIRSSSLGRRRS